MEDDTQYGPRCADDPLPYERFGLNTEYIGFVRNTNYVVAVDEYLPYFVVANFKTGTVDARHVSKKLGLVLWAENYDSLGDIGDVNMYPRKTRAFRLSSFIR